MIAGRRFIFDAAHYLPGHPKCGKLHGHTWTVEVEVEGPIDEQGMVCDFSILKEIVWSVLKNFDHNNINELMPRVPTCETIAGFLYEVLQPKLMQLGVKIYQVKVKEGEGGWARSF